jgi:hypothetical protein
VTDGWDGGIYAKKEVLATYDKQVLRRAGIKIKKEIKSREQGRLSLLCI